MISICQIRAARALLRMSATELATQCNIGQATLKRYELQDGLPKQMHRFYLKFNVT